eukprot:1176404-Prorocentrum_minimum.AAC.3
MWVSEADDRAAAARPSGVRVTEAGRLCHTDCDRVARQTRTTILPGGRARHGHAVSLTNWWEN